MGKYVIAKLGKMRKPQEFSVRRDQSGIYYVQSDKSTGRFDGKGRGWINFKGTYFHHLNFFMGARAFDFPPEFVQECQEIYMLPGEKIGQLGKSPVIFAGITTIGAPTDRVDAMVDHYRTYLLYKMLDGNPEPMNSEMFETYVKPLLDAEREELNRGSLSEETA